MTSPISRVGWRVSVVHSWLSEGGGSSAPIASSSSARTIRWRSVGAIVSAAQGARRASSACSAGAPRARAGGRRARSRRRSCPRRSGRTARARWDGPSRASARSIVRSMGVRIGCGLSTDPDPRSGAIEAAQRARTSLDGRRCDLALVFASGHHLASPESTLEGVDEALAPPQLAGCGAGGVLGAGREVEDGTAVAVWAAALDEGSAEVFHVEAIEGPEGTAVVGLPTGGPDAIVLLPDPYSFPADAFVAELGEVPVLGGISSGRTLDGSAALFCVGEG